MLPALDSLAVPFSTWVADQPRHHAATRSALSLDQQLLVDAELAGAKPPIEADSLAAMERKEHTAPSSLDGVVGNARQIDAGRRRCTTRV